MNFRFSICDFRGIARRFTLIPALIFFYKKGAKSKGQRAERGRRDTECRVPHPMLYAQENQRKSALKSAPPRYAGVSGLLLQSQIACVLSLVSCVLFVVSLAGCGDDEDVGARHAVSLISQGWKEYVAGNYEDAIAKYQEALEEDSASASAYNGIAWARARLGQVRDSIDSFKKAVARDPSSADANAGLAGAYLADGDYERAIASAQLVLLREPEYASHHDDIKAADIRILLAECYYNIGDYAAAKAQIDLLGDAGRALDAASPTYLADLLSLIEELAEEPISD